MLFSENLIRDVSNAVGEKPTFSSVSDGKE